MSEHLNALLEFYRDNDRMVETVERVNDSYLEMLDALEVLEAENAKLRELAKGLSWCSEERYLGHQESECPLYDERTDGKCRAEALMKELGIEVDDGTK